MSPMEGTQSISSSALVSESECSTGGYCQRVEHIHPLSIMRARSRSPVPLLPREIGTTVRRRAPAGRRACCQRRDRAVQLVGDPRRPLITREDFQRQSSSLPKPSLCNRGRFAIAGEENFRAERRREETKALPRDNRFNYCAEAA